jgi:hypothetical protein
MITRMVSKLPILCGISLEDRRRERLTPPEIGILVLAAYIHDMGMALNAGDRQERLSPTSDLWEKLEVQDSTKAKLDVLRSLVTDSNPTISRRAKLELDQAEEALLCQDTRERHATRKRYEALLEMLEGIHNKGPEKVPSIRTCLSFDGDSFREKLIGICVSHNEDPEALVRRDPENPERPQYPRDFPIGRSDADLQMIAAALRLSDILDFDRERTPPTLYYYLIPHGASPADNRAVFEWGKHMAISNWNIDTDAIVFRGRCNDHIIHHAIVQFSGLIQNEIAATRATFGGMQEEPKWPFKLPVVVKADIHEQGYRYVPYRFELDDQRIYELLMGGAIYDKPLVAIRELVQNAVDACKLRDALTQLNEPLVPLTTNRIVVRYEEPHKGRALPVLSVTDSGTGMDAFILERYFLKVGQSYYRSVEFSQERAALRKKNLDFAPVSEFGIGFLSSFLLADRVEVETAMWEPLRGDIRKRKLIIDGPTRLIRLEENPNEGSKRFKGSQVSLYLCRGGQSPQSEAPTWNQIRSYLEDICRDLPYRLHLQYVTCDGASEHWIDPKPLRARVPDHLEPATLRIQINDSKFGLEGEIALINLPMSVDIESDLLAKGKLLRQEDSEIEVSRRRMYYTGNPHSQLLRGGFKVGWVPGLPGTYLEHQLSSATLRLTWESRDARRYISPNLARNAITCDQALEQNVFRCWLRYLLENVDRLPEGQLDRVHVHLLGASNWVWMEEYDALTVYRLGMAGLRYELKKDKMEESIQAWEAGNADRLWLGVQRWDLYDMLLEIVLPRVTSLLIGKNGGRYAGPLSKDWKAVLRGCRDYIRQIQEWGQFAEYIHPIENLLWYRYRPFNARLRNRLHGFSGSELKLLDEVLEETTDALQHGRPPRLTRAESQILDRAIQEFGDLSIGSLGWSRKLESLTHPEQS